MLLLVWRQSTGEVGEKSPKTTVSALFFRPPSRNRIRCNFSGLIARRRQQEGSQHHPATPPSPAPSCQFSPTLHTPPPPKKKSITFSIPRDNRAGSDHLFKVVIKKRLGEPGVGVFIYLLVCFPPYKKKKKAPITRGGVQPPGLCQSPPSARLYFIIWVEKAASFVLLIYPRNRNNNQEGTKKN